MSLVNGQYALGFPIVQKLTDTGFETVGATTNFIGDFSVTPQDAFYQAPPGQIHTISVLNIAVTDAGSFLPTEYGNITALANGILTIVEFNGFEVIQPAKTINTNVELFGVDSNAQIIEYGNNLRTLVARFNFLNPLVLNGDTDDKFILRLSDDFTGLQFHEFTVFGRI